MEFHTASRVLPAEETQADDYAHHRLQSAMSPSRGVATITATIAGVALGSATLVRTVVEHEQI